MSRRFLLALAFCSVALPQAVSAAPIPVTIGFDAIATVGSFTGPLSEEGFVYDLLAGSGGLFGTDEAGWGNPSPVIDGLPIAGGGVLRIRPNAGGLFTFISADISNWDGWTTTLPRQIEFFGRLSGTTVATDLLDTLGETWLTASSVNLASVKIDELWIRLDAAVGERMEWAEAVDNIVLVDAPTPLALLGLGMVLIGYGRRERARQP